MGLIKASPKQKANLQGKNKTLEREETVVQRYLCMRQYTKCFKGNTVARQECQYWPILQNPNVLFLLIWSLFVLVMISCIFEDVQSLYMLMFIPNHCYQ